MRALLFISLALFSQACATRNLARTIGEGEGELRASVGGPLVSNLGAPLPLPNLSVGGRYGVTEGFDVDANLSLTGTLFGLIGFDLGAVGQLYEDPGGFALSVSGRGHFLIVTRESEARFFPELGVHLEGIPAQRLKLYGGLTLFAQFTPPEGKPPVFVAPYVGIDIMLGTRTASSSASGIILELGWVSPWQDSESVLAWEPQGLGAIFAHIGFRTRFDASQTEEETP